MLVPGLAREQTHRAEEVDGSFAADSMLRRLHRERLVLFSGVRALLMQACDPLGVIGFQRHSIIFDDPQARLQRTDGAAVRWRALRHLGRLTISVRALAALGRNG